MRKDIIANIDNGTCPASPMRADEFLDQGNIDGQRPWMRIMRAIEELQRKRPRDGEGMARPAPCEASLMWLTIVDTSRSRRAPWRRA